MTTAKKVTVYHNPVCGKSRGALEILAERGKQVARGADLDAGLRHRVAAGVIQPLLRMQGRDRPAVTRNDDLTLDRDEVRSLHVLERRQPEIVAADVRSLTDCERDVLLDLE